MTSFLASDTYVHCSPVQKKVRYFAQVIEQDFAKAMGNCIPTISERYPTSFTLAAFVGISLDTVRMIRLLNLLLASSLLMLCVLGGSKGESMFARQDGDTFVDRSYLQQEAAVHNKHFPYSQAGKFQLHQKRQRSLTTSFLLPYRRELFWKLWSEYSSFKTQQPQWNTSPLRSGRATLANMHYIIQPIWFSDENQIASQQISATQIAGQMDQVHQYYRNMSWNQMDVSFEIRSQAALKHVKAAKATWDSVEKAVKLMLNNSGTPIYDNMGLMIVFNPITGPGMTAGESGLAIINGEFLSVSRRGY